MARFTIYGPFFIGRMDVGQVPWYANIQSPTMLTFWKRTLVFLSWAALLPWDVCERITDPIGCLILD